ncbi:MAG: JAB domain-containing protein [Bacteroidia bacterium]
MIVQVEKEKKVTITGSKQVYKFLWGLIEAMEPFDKEKEHLYVIGVSRAFRIRYVDWVAMGTMHGLVAGPREVFRNAIHLGASAIILAHNHPSNSVIPSKEDITMTHCMVKAGKILNINVVDHLIVSAEGYYSFADEGVLGSE